MGIIATTSTGLLAGLHTYILTLEMFLWDTPRGRKAFGTTPDFSNKTAILAANQGLYNGFLAAGLIWSLTHPIEEAGRELAIFFSGCVVVAGAYGAWSSSRRILWVQGLPGLITLAAVYFGL